MPRYGMDSYDVGPDSPRTEMGGWDDRQSDDEFDKRQRSKSMPSYRDVLGHTGFLKKEDCGAGIKFDIVNVVPQEFEEDGKPVTKLVAASRDDRSWVINVTNAEALERLFSTDDYDKWRGPVELWNDPSVRFGTNRGGIRVKEFPAQVPNTKLPEVSAEAESILADIQGCVDRNDLAGLTTIGESLKSRISKFKSGEQETIRSRFKGAKELIESGLPF